jgi:hypothetical protein
LSPSHRAEDYPAEAAVGHRGLGTLLLVEERRPGQRAVTPEMRQAGASPARVVTLREEAELLPARVEARRCPSASRLKRPVERKASTSTVHWKTKTLRAAVDASAPTRTPCARTSSRACGAAARRSPDASTFPTTMSFAPMPRRPMHMYALDLVRHRRLAFPVSTSTPSAARDASASNLDSRPVAFHGGMHRLVRSPNVD